MTDVQGVQVRGRAPKALELSDGTTLALEERAQRESLTEWVLTGQAQPDESAVSVAQAMSLAGEEYAEYVSVRTRSEVAWLRLVSEWFAEQADRLDGELSAARA
jgi:hypothetical protein